MIRALVIVATLAGVTPAADARGNHFRDARGFHHWCLSSCGRRHFARHRHTMHHAVPTYSVIITKAPPDDEPAPPPPASKAKTPSPYGELVPIRGVPLDLFRPKGAQ